MAPRGQHILALDQGTTGSTALVFDDRANIVARAYAELNQHFPRPGWVEHDADEIWNTTRRVARSAIRRSKVPIGSISALGITNQRETVVAWDQQTGRALGPAIVWQDRRTASACARLRADGHEPDVRARTGLMLDPYFSATKMQWLAENDRKVGAARAAGTLRWGTIDSWLVHQLTAGYAHVTDISNASRTLLMDLATGQWSPSMLDLFDVDLDSLPKIIDSSGIHAQTQKGVLGAAIPISGIAGDQQAALFGQLCVRPGMAKNTYGTGCFGLINAGTAAPKPAPGILATAAWRRRGRTTYAHEGSVFVAGAAVQWLRDGLNIIESAAQSETLARTVGDTGDVYVVPAFAGLGAPHWDPYARGTIVGLTRGTTKAHLARAVLESIALQSADMLDALAAASGRRLRRLRVDGGATSNALLMQMQADMMGIPVDIARNPETTAQGAAFLAGLAQGTWTSIKQLEGLGAVAKVVHPRMTPATRRAVRSRWGEAVQRSRGWALSAPGEQKR